jgi:hypothetical protein
MNAMLEARIVAVRTQRSADFEQGAAAARERIMLSSHGSWRTGDIFSIQPPGTGYVTVETHDGKPLGFSTR